jgi:tripartite-type tricarboxylate transporter receptor subunit TctC
MPRNHHQCRFPLAIALLATMVSGSAAQDDYPNRTVRIVVPFGPGPFPDAITRIVAGRLQARFGAAVRARQAGFGQKATRFPVK